MTFPKLPDGYRWKVFALIPTPESPGRQVRVSIVSVYWFIRVAGCISEGFGGWGNPHETIVEGATDEKVIAAAEKLHAKFMSRQSLPDEAKRWQAFLNGAK
ncbi:hypothetical protein [Mycobacterium sp. CnD-18-1]|uniref:hypothetical protein n=1 Tax=Mycobacterium sp. CnD-18-1 TaxID=2917744 RepID=UPI001EF1B7D1|nr:hypothetical protein [Mycobacterium sp. CnD-18-1]MCG7607135.1 hypothetical protein [Mycobacterium sp. CnD-18-1]